MEVNIHKIVKEWPITATVARRMPSIGFERRVYIMLRSPLGKRGKALTIYRIPFNDVVRRIRAAFPSNIFQRMEKRKEKRDKVRGRPALNIKRVYITMQPAIPTPGKWPWSRNRRRGRSIHHTAYGYGMDEMPKKIKTCLGTIAI